jgi:hypothetical protein
MDPTANAGRANGTIGASIPELSKEFAIKQFGRATSQFGETPEQTSWIRTCRERFLREKVN